MTLNSSGAISLGGSIAGQSVNLELGVSATATITMNQTSVRTLTGTTAGTALVIPTNFYGKSSSVTASYTFTTSTVNASLNISSLSGYVAGSTNVTVTVNSGVYLWANSTSNYGLNLTGGTTGDTLTLVNNGFIMGQGGTGDGATNSNGNFLRGTAGGSALNIPINTTITNTSGYIGGGGGGGGGANQSVYSQGGSGGGGAGGGYGGGAGVNNANYALGGTGGAINASGGGGDTSLYYCNCCCSNYAAYQSGGGGGRVMPGSGGGGGNYNVSNSYGGGGGGGGGGASLYCNSCFGSSTGGTGGSAGNAGSVGSVASYNLPAGGGGGGYGASGGNGVQGSSWNPYYTTQTGLAGGKAINLNGKTVTWTGGSASSSRSYGVVS